MNQRTCTAFSGASLLARGDLAHVAEAACAAAARGESVLVFDDANGHQIDLPYGSDPAAIRTLRAPRREDAAEKETETDAAMPRGRGRPKLGVVPREVTLLPRHWDWLARQPGGASATLRRLVEQARRANAGADRRRLAQEAAYRVMSSIAGNFAGFDEASRALFAARRDAFLEHVHVWPADVREYVLQLAAAAFDPIDDRDTRPSST
ncbi:DUF2239 family protein [Dokdonella sp.]|uniref:DUF2239 family protein n=1 Tax=Dokdonella sp. TaxID=2291710 RepID=UPI00261ACF82|nr:DUF2239 family protein [Dokdonella sp.]